MAKLTKAQTVTAVNKQIADAEGYDTDELQGLRQKALDYYYNRANAAPSVVGRSSVQSSDVSDMIEAVVAQIMPAFELPNLCEFEPLNADDVEQSMMETEAVNWVIQQQNNGYYEIQQAVRDALLLRNGLTKTYLDEKVNIETNRYEDLTLLELGQIRQGEVDSLDSVPNGHTVEVISEDDDFYTVRVVTKETNRKVCSQAVDINNFMWEREYDSIYLQDCNFCAERCMKTRSELIEKGYPRAIVNRLKPGDGSARNASNARNQSQSTRDRQGSTRAEDLIEVYECYIRLDVDGDGESELLRIVISGKEILEQEEVQYVPYASGTPFLQPHRFNGLGLFDKLETIQDAKTQTLRQMLDNQNHANNSRVGVLDGAVNMDDVVNSRPGGIVRMRDPNGIIPFPFTDIGASAQNTLAYLDKTRSERGGASLDMQSAEAQIAGDTAHGVERQMTAKEQLAALMTKTLAETLIRETYLLVHKALRLYVPDELEFRVHGQFVSVNPSQWQERKSVKVKSGLSLAERNRKRAALETIVMRQDQMEQQGKYVPPADSYNATLDWMRVQGIKDPERYFTDPNSPEAQQAMQQQQQQQQEQAQKAEQYQMELLRMQQEIEARKADNADAKVVEDQRQFNEDLRFKYWEAGLEQGTKEAEMALSVVQGQGKEQVSGE